MFPHAPSSLAKTSIKCPDCKICQAHPTILHHPVFSWERAEFITAFLKWTWCWVLLKIRLLSTSLNSSNLLIFAGRKGTFASKVASSSLPDTVFYFSSHKGRSASCLANPTHSMPQKLNRSWISSTNGQFYRQRLLDKHSWNIKPYVKITIFSHMTCEEKEENMNQISYHYK